jgi:hypothetical protein
MIAIIAVFFAFRVASASKTMIIKTIKQKPHSNDVKTNPIFYRIFANG